MKNILRTLALAAAICIPAFAFAQDDVVNIYSARHYDSDIQLYASFTEATGIQVNVIEAGAAELVERIQSEGANSPADVIITVDAGNLWRAEQAGILAAVESDVLTSAVPANLRHPEGHWFGLAQRIRGIVYNVDAVDPNELSELTTYQDLADDRWEGRVCIRSSSNIYNQSLVASMVATMGVEATEAWAQGVVENFARSPQGGDTDQIRAVAAGECDVAVVNHYYLARLMASTDDADQAVTDAVGWIFPNQDGRGSHTNISGAGVVATAPHFENAVRLVEFLTSPEAQQIFAEGNHEFPVVADVPASVTAQAFGSFETDPVNVSAYGENNPEAVRLMDRVGWR